jgi:hypothetical protein
MTTPANRAIYARAARQARKSDAGPCWCGLPHAAKEGHTPPEWHAMAEPEPGTSRHATWQSFQTWAPDKETVPVTTPNPNAVAEWTAKAKTVAPAVARVLTEHQRKVKQIQRRRDLNDQDRAALLKMAHKDAQQAIDAQRSEFTRAHSAVTSLTERDLRPKAGDTATELRTAAAWSRIQRILDKAPPGDRLGIADEQLRRAVDRDDVDALRAMWRELPDYMAADAPDARGRAEAAKLRDMLVEIAAPPEAAAAHKTRTAWQSGAERVELTLNMADHNLSDGNSPWPTFPGWSEGEMHNVADETAEEAEDSEEARLRALFR